MLVGGEFARACAGSEVARRAEFYPSRTELAAELERHPVGNALVLVKASHGIGLEHIIDKL